MKYLVTPAPHKYSKSSINDMYITISIGLFACLLCGFISYKLTSLYIALCCIGSCFITEFVFCAIKNKKIVMPDFSWLVTALTLACIMPPNLTWYLGLPAGFIAIASKYLFGGLGNNLFNPSALARSIFGVLLTGMSFNYFTADTPLKLILEGSKNLVNLKDIVMGNVSSAIGTGCIIIILIVCVLALVLGIIRWENLLFAIGGYALVVWLMLGGSNVLPMIFSGSFLFVTVFMLSDPTTSPYGFSARCFYALSFGLLAGVFMSKNILGETAVFLALLLANFVSPAFDNLMQVFHKGVKKHD